MKIKYLILAAAFVATAGLTQNAMAHGDDHHHEETATALAPVTISEPLQTIQNTFLEIDAALREKNLKSLHELTERSLQAAKALKESAAPAEANEARFDSAINQLITQIGKLHTASDSNDRAASETEFKKAQGGLKLVESSIK